MSQIKQRLTRWVHQPADQRCKSYIFFTTVGSFIARAVQFGKLPYFSDKTNFLNQVFVKQCWAWTLLLITLITLLRVILDKLPLRKVYIVTLRLMFGTLFWYSMTTIIDGLKDNMGKCTEGEGEYNTRLLCVTEGGSWKYVMDISGHMFMMVFCNLFITKTLDEINQHQDKDPLQLPHVILHAVCRLFVILFDIMMVFTILYWHSPPEKILGTLTGVLGYFLLFKQLSSFIPTNWV
ncbi:acyl-coenzyme A diphosphatase FITM2-like [Bolinopsis microptera]|uniref:acyl-coenzyme A diphosphatase FITM2-like n=1 Tax=Bolinopsis microptera TaxID=2820187 RepID=UPI00307911CF